MVSGWWGLGEELDFEGGDDLVVGGGEGVGVEIGEGDPGVVGDADVLWFATVRAGVKGVEGNTKVGVGMFDNG